MNTSNVTPFADGTATGRPLISVYSGAGGLDLGFARAGFRPVWANDIDPDAVETYNSVFREMGIDVHAVAGDIRKQDLPAPDPDAVVVGGPPCQGFSVAGKMDPDDPRSRHVFDFLGVVKHVQPCAFVMENVMALAENRRWATLREKLREKAADELGYRTTTLKLTAADFGVPQNRQRMFFVGVKDGATPLPVAVPTTSGDSRTVRDVLATLPLYGAPGNDTMCVAKVTPAKNPVLRRSPFAGMLFNGQGRPLDLDKPAPTLPASMGGNRTPIVDQHQLDHGGEHWVRGYHEHLMSGGTPAASIPPRLRRLTVEEAAAIQTFPEGMTWHGERSSQFKQIGNAVPPGLAFHVATALVRALDGIQVGAGSCSLDETLVAA